MESSEGNNTSTTTATVAQPLTPDNAQNSHLRTIQEAVSEGLEFSTSNHHKMMMIPRDDDNETGDEHQMIRIVNMEDGEDEQIYRDSAALIIEDDKDNISPRPKNSIKESVTYSEDDFYENEVAAKATIMKMRNSNALIFFPGDEFN